MLFGIILEGLKIVGEDILKNRKHYSPFELIGYHLIKELFENHQDFLKKDPKIMLELLKIINEFRK